jgi:hypothetical protein
MIVKLTEQSLTFLITGSLLLALAPGSLAQSGAPPPASATPSTATAQQSPEDLDQLVAPIALYPDALIAQILAAAADPTEIVEAGRWLRGHSTLQGTALAQAVNTQPWDPSVKALVQFPSVLQNMDKNLAWTSALGDADDSQPQAVLNAIQSMRRRAEQAGNLKSTPQQTVTTQGQAIVIQPANPEVVYIPQYDPWIVYGAPVGMYPYWDPYPGLYLGGLGLAFGLGIGIGMFASFGWGWGHWGADWRRGRLDYDHRPYIPRRSVFHPGFDYGHPGLAHPGGFHGPAPRPAVHAVAPRPAVHAVAPRPAVHAPAPRPQPSFHRSAFHGFGPAGVTRAYAARGRASFHGGFHGGGRR